jgi:hypothetical protein
MTGNEMTEEVTETTAPGRVAALIGAHPGVRQCTVAATTNRAGERVLVAHYVLWPTAALGAAELRAHLARLLPALPAPLVLRRHAMFPPGRKATLELDLACR